MVVKAVLQWKNPFIRTAALIGLSPFSILFYGLIVIRNFVYDRFTKPVEFRTPVISVGSLSTGGSGKTPLVEFLAMRMTAAGRRVAVVTNGYKKERAGLTVVSDGDSMLTNVEDAGDEGFMLAVNFLEAQRHIPVVACTNRVEAMEYIESRFETDAVILDDAFQYRKLNKTVEIVVQDFYEMRLPAMLLPLGRLRDVRGSLHRADFNVIAKAPENGAERVKYFGYQWRHAHYAPRELVRSSDGARRPLNFLAGKKIILFSALGYPESFEQAVEELCKTFNARVERSYQFQDHHRYDRKDLERMAGSIPRESAGRCILLTTQKDHVKIKREWLGSLADHFYYLRCQFSMEDEDKFLTDAMTHYHTRKTAHG